MIIDNLPVLQVSGYPALQAQRVGGDEPSGKGGITSDIHIARVGVIIRNWGQTYLGPLEHMYQLTNSQALNLFRL